MGFRAILIAAAFCLPGAGAFTAQAKAQGQTSVSGAGSGATGAGSSAAPSTVVQPAGSDAKRKARSRRSGRAAADVLGDAANRPPVRREVTKRGKRGREEGTRSPPAAASAPSGGASVTTPPAQAVPAVKTWPIIPKAAATAGAAVGAAGGGATPAAQPASGWSPSEIQEATAHCAQVLRGVDAAMVPQDPIKEGACGSPVVFLVSSVGKSPSVELSPPVTLTCNMIAAMDKWMKQHVQPKARALIGGPVVKITTMSSYSCRNAYGRTKTRLSEHGKANAIDIASFSTSRDGVSVLAHWGPTVREIKAIAAKQEAERAAAAAAAKTAGGQGQGGLPRAVGPSVGARPLPNIPGVIISGPEGAYQPGGRGFGLAPSRLGGPKAREVKLPEAPAMAVPSVARDPKSLFLKDIHETACKVFGTVLGPEANNAHKNHFHLDMAHRTRSNFCE